MGAMGSQIGSLTIVYSTVHSGADKKKHQSPASLAFVQGIHRWPVNSPHKWPVTRKMFTFDDVIILGRREINCFVTAIMNVTRIGVYTVKSTFNHRATIEGYVIFYTKYWCGRWWLIAECQWGISGQTLLNVLLSVSRLGSAGVNENGRILHIWVIPDNSTVSPNKITSSFTEYIKLYQPSKSS